MASTKELQKKLERIEALKVEADTLRVANDKMRVALDAALDGELHSLDFKRSKERAANRRLRDRIVLNFGILLEQFELHTMYPLVLEGALLAARGLEKDSGLMAAWGTTGIEILMRMKNSTGPNKPQSKARRHNWIKTGAIFEKVGMLAWHIETIAGVLQKIAKGRDNVAARC